MYRTGGVWVIGGELGRGVAAARAPPVSRVRVVRAVIALKGPGLEEIVIAAQRKIT